MDIEKVAKTLFGEDLVNKAKGLAILSSDVDDTSVMARVGEHLVEVRTDGGYTCDCEDAAYRKRVCKHVIKILIDSRFANVAEKFLRTYMGGSLEGKYIRFHPTGLNEVDKLIGGMPEGYLVGLYGPSESGKTILAYQIMAKLARKNNTNILVFDTEGALSQYELWLDKFLPDYDIHLVETGKKLPKGKYVYVYQSEDILDLLAMHGKAADLKISKRGKVELIPKQGWELTIKKYPAYQLLAEGNVKQIIYDSVTEPAEEFGTAQQNLPLRHQAYKWLLTSASKLIRQINGFGIAIFHESVNPQETHSRPRIKGSFGVRYNVKVLLYISKERTSHTPKTEPRPFNVREIWVARHFNRPEWLEYGEIELTSQGFRDYRR